MSDSGVRIFLPCVFESATFLRYRPFGDERYVVARRGSELGFDYGLEQGRRRVRTPAGDVELVAYRQLRTCGAGYSDGEVLRATGIEVLIPRGDPDGFSDAEVARILAAITPAEGPAAGGPSAPAGPSRR